MLENVAQGYHAFKLIVLIYDDESMHARPPDRVVYG